MIEPAARNGLPLAAQAAEVVVLSLTTVMLAFYLLADRERTVGFVYALLPQRYHVRTARILLDMERIAGGYVRGQAITCGLMMVFVFVLLLAVGSPNALALAVLAGVADVIPFVGGIFVLWPAVLSTLSVGPNQAGIVFVALVAYQEFESRVLVASSSSTSTCPSWMAPHSPGRTVPALPHRHAPASSSPPP